MDKQKFAQPEALLPKLLFRRLAREKRLGRAPGPRFVAVGAYTLHLISPSLESVEPTIRSFQSANSPRRNRANASTRRFTPFSGCNRANHLPAEPAEMRRARWRFSLRLPNCKQRSGRPGDFEPLEEAIACLHPH